MDLVLQSEEGGDLSGFMPNGDKSDDDSDHDFSHHDIMMPNGENGDDHIMSNQFQSDERNQVPTRATSACENCLSHCHMSHVTSMNGGDGYAGFICHSIIAPS